MGFGRRRKRSKWFSVLRQWSVIGPIRQIGPIPIKGMIKTQLAILIVFASLCCSQTAAKTVYVHLVDGNDTNADGTYNRPFKSWRIALQHVTSGDTIIAKNGDYRKA